MSYALIRHLRRASLFSQLNRMETTLSSLNQEDLVFRPSTAHWGKVIREAEKIVGYPTSFMNLRWLLSDEFANMAQYLRKVVGSNHPILETAKSVLYNEQNNLQPWGLIILLLSKAITSKSVQDSTIAEHQRILAELTEMIRTGHYVHRGLLNTSLEERTKDMGTALFGNKIALLIGDYLLVTANGMLARLKNQELSYLISTALRDISEGEFFGHRDRQNLPVPGKMDDEEIDEYNIACDTLPLDVRDTLGYPVREWTVRTMFGGGSLFGRGCQGAVMLGGKDLKVQENAYLFGSHLCLAWQAASELQKFSTKDSAFSLVSAPVLFALQSNPGLYEAVEARRDDLADFDFDSFKGEILKTDALDKTRVLYDRNMERATRIAESFGDNQSVDAIKKLMKSY